jgi:mono/diheme cytochrome c family protein
MTMPELKTGVLSLAVAAVVIALAPRAVAEPQAQATYDAAAAAKGAVVYIRFCVSCHGPAARGDGPLAADLRVPVPDMTTLAARSGGSFPAARVERIIRSGEVLRGHGSADMPAWGEAFKKTKGTDARTPEEAIRSLTHYLWSLQREEQKQKAK